ncbi:hypothetical protein ACLOJK_028504 [Asimina triloba]
MTPAFKEIRRDVVVVVCGWHLCLLGAAATAATDGGRCVEALVGVKKEAGEEALVGVKKEAGEEAGFAPPVQAIGSRVSHPKRAQYGVAGSGALHCSRLQLTAADSLIQSGLLPIRLGFTSYSWVQGCKVDRVNP